MSKSSDLGWWTCEGWQPCNCLRMPEARRFQESRMSGNPLVRFDEGRVGRTRKVSPSLLLYCGRCVQACQDLQVNETLSIRWEDPHPRVLWDGGAPIGESSCVSCGHCVTVCPCNALMEKTMLGHAGFLTRLS